MTAKIVVVLSAALIFAVDRARAQSEQSTIAGPYWSSSRPHADFAESGWTPVTDFGQRPDTAFSATGRAKQSFPESTEPSDQDSSSTGSLIDPVRFAGDPEPAPYYSAQLPSGPRNPFGRFGSTLGRGPYGGSGFSRRPSQLRTPPSSAELAGTPIVIGDFFGGSTQVAKTTRSFSFPTTGIIVAGDPGSPNAVLAFERNGGIANDFFTTGPGRIDGSVISFDITEPLPPNEVPTSPGPGFGFDGGTVEFTSFRMPPTQFLSGDIWQASYSFSQTIEIPAGGGLAIRRIKIAEKNSPVPRDRFYFDYKFFRDVPHPFGDVNRFLFGFEKTFFSGIASLDIRLPLAATLDSVQFVNEPPARGVEFGNLGLVGKTILMTSDTLLFSGGLGLTVPSADDNRVFLSDGTQILATENESVHLLPFMAGLWTPDEFLYLQSFLQVDIDVNGNPVFGSVTGGRLSEIGRLQESHLLMLDLSGGYWIFRDPPCSGYFLRGLAAILELHYTSSLQDSDVIAANGFLISDRGNRIDVLNFTAGIHGEIAESFTITAGMGFPLRDGDDRQFDHEVTVLAN